jgi:Phasin protein
MQAQLFDFYRSGMKTAAEFARTSLENTVRLQQKQLDMVRNILDENSRSTDRLGQARNIEDLVGMQSQLAGTQLQRIAEFWTSAWQIAAENQKAVIEQWPSQLGKKGDEMPDAAAAAARSAQDMMRMAAQQERKGQEPHRKSA